MINEIVQFDPILQNLINYNKEDKAMNKETIAKINQLLIDKENDSSDMTYEWQCYLLIMYNQVIKELIHEEDECDVTYAQFRMNIVNWFRPNSNYHQLNESVLMFYPEETLKEIETETEKKEEELNDNDGPTIYYKEEMSFDNSGSLIIYEEIEIDDVKEIDNNNINTDEPLVKIDSCEKEEEQFKLHEHLKEQYFNERSHDFIQKSLRENQTLSQSNNQLQNKNQTQVQSQQQNKTIQKQYNTKSDYIIDANNDLTKRIDELLEKINVHDSIVSFIKYTSSTNDISISTLLHYHLSLIPNKKTYDTISINRIITLSLFFFPFLTENQKNSNLDRIKALIPKQNMLSPLLSNLFFIPIEKDNRQFVTDIICSIVTKRQINHEVINKRIQSIQTLDDIKGLFILQLLIGIIMQDNNNTSSVSIQLELALSNVSFIMIYIIQNEKLFPMLNIHQMLMDCYIIKKVYEYYKLPFDALVSFECDKTISIIFNNEKLNKSKEDMTIEDYQLFLFENSIVNRYQDTLTSIKHFYVINDFSLVRFISNRDLQFSLGVNELQFISSRLKYNNLSSYRQKLIRLEGELYQIAKDTFDHSSFVFSSFTLPNNIKYIFNSLKTDLKRKFSFWNFTLYPFGSITQFLSSNNSDLDVYLDLNNISKDYRVLFVRKLFNYIQEMDRDAFNSNSFRICLISFTFQGLKIDLSCFALCPYLHSNLLRCYSLMDSRFPILATCLKHFLSILNLKNDNLKNSTLNSFCWIMLLIVFLQDIISPPVLPKLQMNSNSIGKLIEIGGGKPKHLQKTMQNNYQQNNPYRKTIQQVFDNTSFHYIEVSPSNFANYDKIYTESIQEKNMMALSELFLKFLEFVLFLFKYDTIFPSFCFFNECFMNISRIKEHMNDFGLRRFYFMRYLTKPKGEILFREPFDYNYNPGQSLNNANAFFNKLKQAYIALIENGSFRSLINLKNENDNNLFNDNDNDNDDSDSL